MSGAGVAAVGFLGDDCVAEDDDAVGAVVIKSDAAFFMLPCEGCCDFCCLES